MADIFHIGIGVIKIKKGLRVYSSKKIVLTEQEKEDLEQRIQKQLYTNIPTGCSTTAMKEVILHACMIEMKAIECSRR